MPLASTRASILVVSPPRERPMQQGSASSSSPPLGTSTSPFFAVGGVLVDTDGGPVGHLQIAVVGCRNRGKQTIPHADLAPSDKPMVADAGRPVAGADVRPRRSCAKPPEDPVQHLAFVRPRNPARLVRQQWLDNRPLEVAQVVTRHARLSKYNQRPLQNPPRPTAALTS